MPSSNRRLGRSPARRRETTQLAALEQQYLLHHGALGHSPKTFPHYQNTFKPLDRFLQDRDTAPTTEIFTTAVMIEFALWLRDTLTRCWRGSTKRSEAGIHGTMTDMRDFARWLLEEGHIEALPKQVAKGLL